jgi:hypothetical protein
MCIFVHKSVKNARFSPRKVQKRGFFAGGRGDFLAGQKRGFLGSRGGRVRAWLCRVKGESRLPHAAPTRQSKWKKLFFNLHFEYIKYENDGNEVFYERIVTKSIIGHYYRHSELAERTESVINHFHNLIYSLLFRCRQSRAAWMTTTAPYLPSHSLDRWVPTRETCALTPFVSTPKNVLNPIFWPHGHSMPPRSKILRNFRNFAQLKNKF